MYIFMLYLYMLYYSYIYIFIIYMTLLKKWSFPYYGFLHHNVKKSFSDTLVIRMLIKRHWLKKLLANNLSLISQLSVGSINFDNPHYLNDSYMKQLMWWLHDVSWLAFQLVSSTVFNVITCEIFARSRSELAR